MGEINFFPDDLKIKDQKIILRLDLNVPIKDKVIAYVACSGRTTTHPTYPSDEYRDFIINGATQHGLPGKYITKIEELASPSSLQILRNADAAWEASKNG